MELGQFLAILYELAPHRMPPECRPPYDSAWSELALIDPLIIIVL
jgi:hypothetical protein